MKRYDKISSLFWLFCALLICIQSVRLPLGSWDDPGPGFLPLGSGIILGLLSAVAYLQAFRSKSENLRESWSVMKRWKSLILVLASLFCYTISLEILGFLLGTFLLLIVLSQGVEPQKWVVSILGSALISIASYVVFELWLKTQLPKGILGF